MKRTNLVLDEHLLHEATRVLGVKTYSAAVNLALQEILRIRKIQSLPCFLGRVQWQGDLSEMRQDNPPPKRREPANRSRRPRRAKSRPKTV